MMEKLRVDLLTIDNACVLTQLLTPSVEIALHDHNYVCNPDSDSDRSPAIHYSVAECVTYLPDDVNQVLQEIGTKSPLLEKMKLNVTPVERDNVERIT